jgi:N-acetylglutamate synthase-like GNAT family acetyltransferase
MSEVAIRAAKTEDAPGIAASVCEAHVHYIERIGKQPGPMLEDYAEVIQQFQVHVAVASGKVVGAVVLKVTDEGFYVDNVAVRPWVKGRHHQPPLRTFRASRRNFTYPAGDRP